MWDCTSVVLLNGCFGFRTQEEVVFGFWGQDSGSVFGAASGSTLKPTVQGLNP